MSVVKVGVKTPRRNGSQNVLDKFNYDRKKFQGNSTRNPQAPPGQLRSDSVKTGLLLDELYKIFTNCDPNCAHCDKLIFQLHQHMTQTHGQDYESKSDVIFHKSECNISNSLETMDIKLEPEDVVVSNFSPINKNNEDIRINIPQPTASSGRKTTGSNISFTCRFCIIPFFDVSTYKCHFKKYHPKEVPFVVKTTPNPERNVYLLKEPIYITPRIKLMSSAPDKIHQCEVCAKIFDCAPNLKQHIRIHSEERKYTCEVCGKRFKTISNLYMHKRSHQEKQHGCKTCGLKLSRACDMKSHMRTHTGEKPYMCELCGKCFSSSASIAKHRKIHNKPLKRCRKTKE